MKNIHTGRACHSEEGFLCLRSQVSIGRWCVAGAGWDVAEESETGWPDCSCCLQSDLATCEDWDSQLLSLVKQIQNRHNPKIKEIANWLLDSYLVSKKSFAAPISFA